jgi:beta-lactam-binding protein with PASTA domain
MLRLPRPSRAWLSRQPLIRAGLAVALGAGVLTVAFSAGYRSADVVLTDDGTYVQKGHRVVHVNANSGGVDARAPEDSAQGDTRLKVTQDGSGAVIVVNPDTGEVTRLPSDSLTPSPVTSRPASPGLRVRSGGGQAYLLDPEQGTVSRLPDGGAGAPTDVRLPARVDQLVVDGAGTAWGYSTATGDLLEIAGGQVRSRQHAGTAGERITLTLAGGHPVLYDADTGEAVGYGGGVVPVNMAASNGIPAAPGAAVAVLIVVVPASAELIAGDLRSGQARHVRLPGQSGDEFAAPVVAGGRIYLPDLSQRVVTVLGLADLRVQRATRVPGRSTFEVTANGDRVWVNDPYERRMLTFDRDGKPDTVDKGTGDGQDPETLPGDPEPSPSAAPVRPAPQDVPVGPATTPRTTTVPPRQRAPKRVPVPDLVGMDRARAKQRCEQVGLDCRFVAKNAGTGRTDEVLSTNPPAGTTVESGDVVNVVYRGPASVPDLVGSPVDQACQTLGDVQLQCVRQVAGLADNVPAVGKVAGQQPAAGASVTTGTTIVLSYPDHVRTPGVTGAAVAAACATVTALGLSCARQDLGAAPPGQPVGTVVQQAPVAGAGADPAQPVTVSFYGGVGVPAVTGVAPDAACGALQAAQLVCDRSDSEQTTACNVVHRQSIGPAAVVPPGTGVTITYISACPAPLHRYKAPAPRRANYLTLGGGGPGGWSSQSDIASVYPADKAGIAGLVPVYVFCYRACDADPATYYYSQNPAVQVNYAAGGAAFSCFAGQPAGTRPLVAMFNGQVWVWARYPSGEYDVFHTANPAFVDQFTVCYVW